MSHESKSVAELHVHRWVWMLLATSVCLAVIVPTLELWHAYQTPITADISLMTALVRPGEPTRLIVSLDGISVPLAQATVLQARTDMVGMPMGMSSQQDSALPGEARYLVTWSYSMVGTWWVECSLAMPGYAPWHQRIMLTVTTSAPGGHNG